MPSSIDELQRLSLVSKVCTELDNHLGLSDRTLAEFIIHLADEFPEPPAFRQALAENGAEFPDSLSDNLLRIIGAMKPDERKEKAARAAAVKIAASRVPRNETDARFPGLAMPNTKVVQLEDGFGEVNASPEGKERDEEGPKGDISKEPEQEAGRSTARREESKREASPQRRKRERLVVFYSHGPASYLFPLLRDDDIPCAVCPL